MFWRKKKIHQKCRICGKIDHIDQLEEAGHRGKFYGNCMNAAWYNYFVHPECAKNDKRFKSIVEKLPRRWYQK